MPIQGANKHPHGLLSKIVRGLVASPASVL